MLGKEVVGKPSNKNRYRVRLFTVGTDTAKDIIFSRPKIKNDGPGCMHFPTWIDDEYLEQLTAEKAIRKYVKGRGAIREYVKTRERNEVLDLTVYSLAILYTLGQQTLRRLGGMAQELARPEKAEVKKKVEEGQGSIREPLTNKYSPVSGGAGSSWVNSW